PSGGGVKSEPLNGVSYSSAVDNSSAHKLSGGSPREGATARSATSDWRRGAAAPDPCGAYQPSMLGWSPWRMRHGGSPLMSGLRSNLNPGELLNAVAAGVPATGAAQCRVGNLTDVQASSGVQANPVR